jgi:hypothetical protein
MSTSKRRDKAYLYMVKDFKMYCYAGYVTDDFHLDTNEEPYGYFYTTTEHNVRRRCTAKPGEFYNGVMWLPERNDRDAKKLFIIHYEEQIDHLNECISRVEKCIDVVKLSCKGGGDI